MVAKYVYMFLGIVIAVLLLQKKDLEQDLFKEQTERKRYEALYTKSRQQIEKLQILADQNMQRIHIFQKEERERKKILNQAVVNKKQPQGIIDEKTRHKVIFRLNRPL